MYLDSQITMNKPYTLENIMPSLRNSAMLVDRPHINSSVAYIDGFYITQASINDNVIAASA